MIDPAMRHTAALRYSRWERLCYRVTGRWPRRTVERRLLALALDEAEMREAFSRPITR